MLQRCRFVLIAFTLVFCLSGASYAQIPDASGSPMPGSTQRPREDPWTAEQRKAMEKQRNLQRQEDLKKDSEKLLELATELKQYVDKTNENTLSLDVIKKAEQIEKLARSVKEKMKIAN